MAQYKLPLNNHLEHLANGRPVAPGEIFKLSSKEEEENKELIEAKLIKVEGGEKK